MKLSKKALLERDWEENFFVEEKIPFGSLEQNKKKILFFICLLVVCFSIFFWRIFYLQVIKKEYFQGQAEKNTIRQEEILAPRGLIYDRNGNLLVENIPSFDLTVVPIDLPRNSQGKITEDFLRKLSEILDEPFENLEEKFKDLNLFSTQEKIIKEKIDREKILRLKIEISDLPGIKIRQTSRRNYLYGPILAHLLGYTAKPTKEDLEINKEISPIQWIGKEGIEKRYENFLKGKNGKRDIEIDALARERKIIKTIDPQQGKDIFLTIDLGLQKKVFEIFENYQKRKGKKIKGAAVGLNPQNGEVLFLLSFPSFDNNLFSQGIEKESFSEIKNDPQKPLFNRVIAGLYPSGSIIKPLVGLAALEEKIISSQTLIFDPGQIRIKEWIFPCWKKEGHGQINLIKAIAQSCDVFFYIIGGGFEEIKGLGIERLASYLKKFGLGEKTGIDLLGEKEGLVPDKEWKEKAKKEKWYVGDTYHLAIGQGDLLISPLQAASFASFLANQEGIYQPHLVKKIDQEEIKSKFKKIEINKKNIEIVRKGMKEMTKTSWLELTFREIPIETAGKTGTAQFGKEDKTHAWFICFAPYENPEIALAVLIEEQGEGYKEAMPLAKEILKEYFSNLNAQ